MSTPDRKDNLVPTSKTVPASKTVPKSKKKPSDTWGSKWLHRLETTATFSNESLERGRAYALHDWQLEVDLEPGKAEALARSGPRIRNRAAIEVPVLSDNEWSIVIGLIANSSARTAALLDHEIDPNILSEAKSEGVSLLPAPRSLKVSCSCRNWGELCKHSSAVVYLLADVFDEAPFDLFLWRGLSYEDLGERVHQRRSSTSEDSCAEDSTAGFADTAASNADRSGTSDEQDPVASKTEPPATVTINALDAWNRTQAVLPLALVPPQTAAVNPPYPSDAPPIAPFTGPGLHSLVVDAVARAHRHLTGTEGADLELGAESDLARRAANVEGTEHWSRLVLHSGRSSRELSTKASAWRIAGSAGVEIVESSRDVLEINKFVQFRKNELAQWFRFEKISGRWQLVSGPAMDPAMLESETGDIDTATD
jgi:uncharacterized Zn finger protein